MERVCPPPKTYFSANTDHPSGLMFLHGLTNYGDSVEDEWLIVYILRELSNRFPQLWVKVVDTDGEFLLIEAANALPRWLNPEIAENRVRKHPPRADRLSLTFNRFGYITMHCVSFPSAQYHPLVLRQRQFPDPSLSTKPIKPSYRRQRSSYIPLSSKRKHSTDYETTHLKLRPHSIMPSF